MLSSCIMSLECWNYIHFITWHFTNLQSQNLFTIFLIGRFYSLSTYTINQKPFNHSGTEKNIELVLVHQKWDRNKNIFSAIKISVPLLLFHCAVIEQMIFQLDDTSILRILLLKMSHPITLIQIKLHIHTLSGQRRVYLQMHNLNSTWNCYSFVKVTYCNSVTP